MEIGEEERYAAGALFTLALHLTQVEYGAGGDGTLDAAWGAGDESEWEEEVRRAEDHKEPSQAVWAAYWGYDSCGPGGILDRLFTALRIPKKSWGGLKRLPEVGGISYERRHSYMHLVSNFLQVLDSTLPTAHVISASYRPSAPALSQSAGTRHVGYLPQVDDMLGMHPGSMPGQAQGAAPAGAAEEGLQSAGSDPFAASSQALQMRSASMAASTEREGHSGSISSSFPTGEGIAQLNSSAAKQREAELLLDDSDSDMEADVVFAHVMARQHGVHARQESSEATDHACSTSAAEACLSNADAAAPGPLDKRRACHAAADSEMTELAADSGQRDNQSGLSSKAEPPLPASSTSADEQGVDQSIKSAAAGGSHPGEAGASPQQPEGLQHNAAGPGLPGAPSLARLSSHGRGKKPSQKAVAAMWELLESSIAPQLQLDTGSDAAGGKQPEHVPRVRWYDARVRTALRRVASWLNVPWPAVGNFEHLLAYQVLLPAQPGAGEKQGTAWEQGLWAAKVGATTVGIGALFAVTGGLAAPAIAAGIGAAISLAGGGAAAAAGATGFLATTAGAAAVMSGMGVAGGSYAGAHMARRIGGVKELGFWEVNEATLKDVHEVAPTQEEMQAAADAASLTEGNTKRIELTGNNEATAITSQAPAAQGWAASWDDDKPSGKQSITEPPRSFSPQASRNIDDFLQSTSTALPKEEKKHARTASVAMELREMVSRPRQEEMEMDAYMRPEAPLETDTGHLDAGHVCFSAIPRAATPPLVVTPATSDAVEERSGAAEGETSQSGQHKQRITCRAGSEGSRDASKSAEEGRGRSPQPAQGAEGREPRRWGAGAKHGSAASLDSAASDGSQMRFAAAKDPGRWLWKPKWREPPLLLAPISPNGRPDDMRMSLTIGVSGWIGQRKDYLKVWSTLEAPDSEVFTLVWESKALLALNSAIGSFMAQQAYQEIAKWTITHFFYTGLVAALATPWILVSFSQMIDHAWAVALNRAQKAGILLAHILMSGGHGERPVTLIGYSMGARLIFHCLLELCRHSAKGIVEHVVVMGAPVSTRLERWAMARSVVAGRFVNAYSRRDWVLGLIYRGANGFIKGAGGLCPLNCVGIENINLTSIIAGHFDYISKMEEILELVAIQSSR